MNVAFDGGGRGGGLSKWIGVLRRRAAHRLHCGVNAFLIAEKQGIWAPVSKISYGSFHGLGGQAGQAPPEMDQSHGLRSYWYGICEADGSHGERIALTANKRLETSKNLVVLAGL
jgi:hypothetical protein